MNIDYVKVLTNIEKNRPDFIDYVLGIFDSQGFDFDVVEFYHRSGFVSSIRLCSIVFGKSVYRIHYTINKNSLSRTSTYNPENIDYDESEIETLLKSIIVSYERKRKIKKVLSNGKNKMAQN